MRFQAIVLGWVLAAGLQAGTGQPGIPVGWTLAINKAFDMRLCDKNPSPFLVSGDFNGDGKKDQACLVTRDGVTRMLVIFSCESNSTAHFVESTVKQIGPAGVELRLHHGPKTIQETDASDSPAEPSKVTVKADYFELVFCGKSSIAYYWDAAKMKFGEIWTSD